MSNLVVLEFMLTTDLILCSRLIWFYVNDWFNFYVDDWVDFMLAIDLIYVHDWFDFMLTTDLIFMFTTDLILC